MAQAFTSRTVHLQGVTITAVPSDTAACGVDFLISVSDADQHFVKIDYTYNGTFIRGPDFQKGSATGVINISVGNMTYDGLLARSPGGTRGLACNFTWDYQFIASQDNLTQAQRDRIDEQKRREQDKRSETERRRAEQEERQRRAKQLQEELKRLNAKAEQERLANYRRLDPLNARCVIIDQADVQRCEQFKLREREERARSDAEAARAKQQQEIEKLAAADMDRASREALEKAVRDMEANNCSYAAGLPAAIPYPSVNTNNAQHEADVKRIDALNYAAQQAFSRALKAASDACDQRRRGGSR